MARERYILLIILITNQIPLFHYIMSLSDLPKLWTTYLLEHLKILIFKVIFQIGWIFPKQISLENIGLWDQLLLKKHFENFYFLNTLFSKNVPNLSALFIILVGLMVTLFIEKMLVSTKCILDQKMLGRYHIYHIIFYYSQLQSSLSLVPMAYSFYVVWAGLPRRFQWEYTTMRLTIKHLQFSCTF